MKPIYVMLFITIVGALVSIMNSVLKKKRAGSAKYQNILAEFNAAVSAMLEEGEKVEAVCGYRPCAAVTDKRLLISSKTGIVAIPFSHIRSLKGMDTRGNKTRDPRSIFVLEIKADKKYSIGNESEGFEDVVRALYKHTGA